MSIQFFRDGDPVYQPIPGYVYHRPVSRTSKEFWTMEGCLAKLSRYEVAQATGVDLRELTRWENAADNEAELESRAEEGDW